MEWYYIVNNIYVGVIVGVIGVYLVEVFIDGLKKFYDLKIIVLDVISYIL